MNNYKINTPAQYQAAWDSYLNINAADISPKLLATIHFPEANIPFEQNYLYPKGFYYAWAFSNTNLALFLELNHLYGQSDPTKVSVGMAEIVGFTGLEGFSGANLAVYTLPDTGVSFEESPVLVPTIQTWMRILDGLGYPVPLDVSIALTQQYASLESNQDVVNIYSQFSGLERGILLDPNRGYAPTDPTVLVNWESFNISTEQQAKYQYIMCELGLSPYHFQTSAEVAQVGEVTLKLFANLPGVLNSMNPTTDVSMMVMAVRAALAQGQDASALNTTVGVGYNIYPNPFVCKPIAEQSIDERYTGLEFIVLNRRFDDCQQYVSFKLDAQNSKRPYLKGGWCE